MNSIIILIAMTLTSNLYAKNISFFSKCKVRLTHTIAETKELAEAEYQPKCIDKSMGIFSKKRLKFCEGDTVSYLGGKNKATFFDDDYVYGPAVQSASRRFRVSINKIEKVDYSPDCDKRQEILQKDAFFILCQKGHLKKDPRCRY